MAKQLLTSLAFFCIAVAQSQAGVTKTVLTNANFAAGTTMTAETEKDGVVTPGTATENDPIRGTAQNRNVIAVYQTKEGVTPAALLYQMHTSEKKYSAGNDITIDGSKHKTIKLSNAATNKLTVSTSRKVCRSAASQRRICLRFSTN